MNPGAVEEGAKTAGIFMQIMKDQPLSLALVIMNLCLLGFFFYVAKIATDNRRHEFEMVMKSQEEVQKLLFNCVPVGKTEFTVPLPLIRPPDAPRD